MTNTAVLAPDFEDQQFSAPVSERPPIALIINPRFGRTGILPYGFAITKKDAESCSFDLPENWEIVEHEWPSGDKEIVLMTLKPRLLILSSTPVYLKSRNEGFLSGKMREKNELIGEMRKFSDFWKNKNLYKTASWSYCYVLGQDNKPCHTAPIRISLGGASGASFNASWLQHQTKETNRGGFCCDMEKAYAQSRKQPYKPMGDLFHAHCIYEPTITDAVRGIAPNTANVAVVESYKPAIMSSLVTNGSELSEQIKLSRELVKDWRPSLKETATEDDGYSPKGKPNPNEFNAAVQSAGQNPEDDEFGYPPY
jgi:hypothetical protein